MNKIRLSLILVFLLILSMTYATNYIDSDSNLENAIKTRLATDIFRISVEHGDETYIVVYGDIGLSSFDLILPLRPFEDVGKPEFEANLLKSYNFTERDLRIGVMVRDELEHETKLFKIPIKSRYNLLLRIDIQVNMRRQFYDLAIPITVDNDDDISKYSNSLDSVFPNPFNNKSGRTSDLSIQFTINEPNTDVLIGVYDLRGRLVKEIVNRRYNEGINTVYWDGTDITQKNCSSGIYFIRSKIGTNLQSKKMILTK